MEVRATPTSQRMCSGERWAFVCLFRRIMTKPEDWGGASSNTRTFEHCDTCCLSLLLSSPPFFQLHPPPLLFTFPFSFFLHNRLALHYRQRSKSWFYKKLVLLTIIFWPFWLIIPALCLPEAAVRWEKQQFSASINPNEHIQQPDISSLSNGGMYWHLLVPSKPQCFCVRGDLKDYSKNFNFTVFSPELEPRVRLANSKRQQ